MKVAWGFLSSAFAGVAALAWTGNVEDGIALTAAASAFWSFWQAVRQADEVEDKSGE